jgi:hypothetical protein
MFAGQCMNSAFLCDCGAMEHQWDTMHGSDTSRSSFDDFCAQLNPCKHAQAIRYFHDIGCIPYGSMEPSCFMGEVNFSSIGQPITILQSSNAQLLLSCDFGYGEPFKERTRAVIRTDRNRHYNCTHCPPGQAYSCAPHIQKLDSWFTTHAESEESCGEVFDGFSIRDPTKSRPAQPCDESDDASCHSISYRRIPFDFSNERTKNRAISGEDGLIHYYSFYPSQNPFTSSSVLIFLSRGRHPSIMLLLPCVRLVFLSALHSCSS